MKLIKYRHLDCPQFLINPDLKRPAYCPFCESAYIEIDDEITLAPADEVVANHLNAKANLEFVRNIPISERDD